MAAVIGLLDILLWDDGLTNEQYTTVTQIRKSSTALMGLLNNILDLSKVESGKLVLEEAEFDLGRELEALLDMFSVQCINHNVETILDLSDDIPKVIRGDSARMVQIFANLISNSIKFTTSGHVVLRGWCEKAKLSGHMERDLSNQKESGAIMSRSRHQGRCRKNVGSTDNKVIFWFEVDDTGCGIDPSKWESVFESFEQADLSTTRTHGGTGLGLCIVRTLVNKMGGEIRVVKKNGPGTLMRLNLVLTSTDSAVLHAPSSFRDHNLAVLLAFSGCTIRSNMSRWLQEKGVSKFEVTDWNELTQILNVLLQIRCSVQKHPDEKTGAELLMQETLSMDIRKISIFLIVVDVALLDLSTNMWKEKLNCLDRYLGTAKFAWVLNHDTSNLVKIELRRKGHRLMVNRPLYKTKIMQILEAVNRERVLSPTHEHQHHECLDIVPTHSNNANSDDDYGEAELRCNPGSPCKFQEKKKRRRRKAAYPSSPYIAVNNNCAGKYTEQEQYWARSNLDNRANSLLINGGGSKGQRCLEGLRILLAEDTPVLQKVATIMLEKLGAIVFVAGDGLQAVNALQECREGPSMWDDSPSFDLVLMDCQMPKMDGYEATKEIRKSELGTGFHIPIVALTAHAMSSDEARCLEVGMDAYLTKPIDSKLMVSTILTLTRSERASTA
ncbi:hypothetical protein Dimus_017386 [Dionaea muscipula]